MSLSSPVWYDGRPVNCFINLFASLVGTFPLQTPFLPDHRWRPTAAGLAGHGTDKTASLG